jgi:hypothetical protein
MKLFKKPLRIFSILALLAVGLLFSCDSLKNSEENYKIFAIVTCDGSSTATTDYNSMTINYYVDKKYPFNAVINDVGPIPPPPQPQLSFTLPKKMTTITVTVNKTSTDSTVNILIYKITSDSTKIVKYINLPSCIASTTSCSNTISLSYDVSEDDAKAASGTTTSSTSSSSSSSTSSTSSGSSSSSSSG